MSAIYEVEHEHTGERLALKVLKDGIADLDPQTLARFRREARVSALVKSEHIVRVVDADVAPELDGAPFLVMDLLEGGDLSEVAGATPQAPETVVAWLRQVAKALDRAHALGIVHRDLKPENLYLVDRPGEEPTLKILDFGVAKVRASEEAGKTATGSVVGTPLYMAPEQASGEIASVGPATDVWAIGVIAFRLLTAKDYWTGPTVPRILAEIVYGKVEPPSTKGTNLGPAFDAWFMRSCCPQPEGRWSSVTEQVEALAEALGVAPAASGDVRQTPASNPKRSNPDAARVHSASHLEFGETVPSPLDPVNRDVRVSRAVTISAATAPERGKLRVALIAIPIGVALASGAFFLSSRPERPSPGIGSSLAVPTATASPESPPPPASVPPASPPPSASASATATAGATAATAAPPAPAPKPPVPAREKPPLAPPSVAPSTTSAATQPSAAPSPPAPAPTPQPKVDPLADPK